MAIKLPGRSGYSQTVVNINEFGLQERTRTSPTGKTGVRFTVSIDAQPLAHIVDPKELGRRPAEAIADHLRKRVETIQTVAGASTQLARKNAAVALTRGVDWAKRRYSGGRIGPMAPNATPRVFNDSGRFAKGLIARPVGESGRAGNGNLWVVNVPANRFDPSTLNGPEGRNGLAALQQVYATLLQYVPEFGDPAKLMNIGSVKEAIVESYKSILQRNGDLRSRLSRSRMAALSGALALFR